MRRMLTVLAVLITAGWTAAGHAASLATDLSSREIAITSSFSGTSLLLFGSRNGGRLEGPVDVIAVVHGPEQPMTIYRKERKAGIWVNSDPVSFHNVPGFYAVASNRPLTDIVGADYLRRENIGPENLVLVSVEDVSIEKLTELRRAIIADRSRMGLYEMAQEGVTFPDGDLFRADIYFPAQVPVGDYRVIVRMFRDGEEIGRSSSIITVGKQGLEQWIYNVAQHQSLLYGIAAVLIAVAAGWIASVVFRRR